MQGKYTNARRGNYGPDIDGPDFLVDGLGSFSHITHAEVKGCVSSTIPPCRTLNKSCREYVRRIKFQRKFWSNQVEVRKKFPHLNLDANLPNSGENMLALYDLWDVGTPEKSMVKNLILARSGDDSSLLFLNDSINM